MCTSSVVEAGSDGNEVKKAEPKCWPKSARSSNPTWLRVDLTVPQRSEHIVIFDAKEYLEEGISERSRFESSAALDLSERLPQIYATL